MDDHTYFRAIEDHFIGLRGAPLLLSPADFQVARRWHREGIPLELIRSALDGVFARRAERGTEAPIQSLRYCSAAVQAAWERSAKMAQAGRREEAAPLDLPARLEALAEAIPRALSEREKLRESLRHLAEQGLGAEKIERSLARLDRELIAAAYASLEDDRREELERAVERSLDVFGGRLTAEESELTRTRLREQALRRELQLPVLSLFSA